MENQRQKNIRHTRGHVRRWSAVTVLSGLALSACGVGSSEEPGGGETTAGGDDVEFASGLTIGRRMGAKRDPDTMMSANMLPMAAPPGGMPGVVDLTNQVPPPGNQGQEGSCVGWAVGYAAKSQVEVVEEGWSRTSTSNQFSPSWVYNQINGGVDGGSSISDALNLIVSKGADSIAKFPYVVGDFKKLPDGDSFRRAHRYPNASWNTVAVNTSQIKNALASGKPVILGIEVRPDWDGMNSTTNQVYDIATGTVRGLHAVTLIGFDDSRQAFKVINSWGTGWGSAGYGWIAYSMTGTSVIFGAWVMTDSWNRLTAVGAPAQAVLGSQLHLAYVGDTSTTAGGQPLMHVSSSDALKAGAETQIGGHASNAPPSMAVLNGVIHAVYISANSANALLHVSSTDGVNWGTETTIAGHSSKAAPAITTLNGVLHLVYISNNSANTLLHLSSTDGVNWSTETTVAGHSSKTAPTITSFGGQIHLAYVANNSTNTLLHVASSDGVNWGTETTVGTHSTTGTPALATDGSQLHLAYIAANATGTLLHIASSDGVNWGTETQVAGHSSKAGPSMTYFNGALRLAYVANNSSNALLKIASSDGVNWGTESVWGD